MKPFFQILGFCALLAGCATYTTEQVRVEFNPTNGVKVLETRTKVKAKTLLDAKSELAKSTVSQTEKNQTSKIGSVNQESNSTNAVAILGALADVVKALPK